MVVDFVMEASVFEGSDETEDMGVGCLGTSEHRDWQPLLLGQLCWATLVRGGNNIFRLCTLAFGNQQSLA